MEEFTLVSGESPFSFSDFSVELGNIEVKKTKKYDRFWNISEGGSIDQHPLIFDGKVYFGSFNHNLYCLDATTGELIWKFKARERIGISSPVEYQGIIYIGSYDFNLYALNAKTGEMLWRFPTMGGIISSVGVYNDTVFFGSIDKIFYAIDSKSGNLKWKYKTYGEICSDPTFHKGKVIFSSYDKNIYCLNVDNGLLLWKIKTDQETMNFSPFAIRGDEIYLSAFDNHIRKVDVNTGHVIWKRKISQRGIESGTVIHNEMIIVPTEDGNILGLDLEGNTLWKFSTTKPIGTPVVFGERIYFTSEDMNIYCISIDGKLIWKYKTQDIVWWMPAIWQGNVYFGSYDCHFYVLDTETGALRWKYRTEGSPSHVPPIDDYFEVVLKVPESEFKEEKKKGYELDFQDEKEEATGTYKSRVTYQISTQYAAMGKYQKDSNEEEF